MKILVFDIGGTAIKYGICQDGHLMETSECPTEAYKGGPHILETICTLAEQSSHLMPSASAPPVRSTRKKGISFMPTATSRITQVHSFRKSFRSVSMFLSQ